MKTPKRWPYVLGGVVFGCPCLLLGLGLTFLRHSFTRVADTLPREIATARAAQLPTDAGELRTMLAVREADNAAPIYRAAFAAMKEVVLPKDWSAIQNAFPTPRRTETEMRTIEGVLKRSQRALDLFREASTRPRCDWQRHWENGSILDLPEYGALKDAAKRFSMRAILAADTGNGGEAIEACRTMYRLGFHVAQDPTVIAVLVAFGIDQMATSTLMEVIDRCRDRATLLAARQLMERLQPLPAPERGLLGEIVMMRSTIEDFDRLVGQTGSSDVYYSYDQFPGSWLVRDKSYRKAWQSKMLHYTTEAYVGATRQRSWKGKKSAFATANAECEADSSIENYLNRDLGPVMTSAPDSWARTSANRRIAAACVEAMIFLVSHGEPHATLPISGDCAADPFTLRPLRYRVEGKGFRIYSVDSDERDDGGLTRREDLTHRSRTHDIAYAFK